MRTWYQSPQNWATFGAIGYALYTGKRSFTRIVSYASAAYLTSLALVAGFHVILEKPLDQNVFDSPHPLVSGAFAAVLGMLAISVLPKYKRQGWLA